ncbi:hypothetical protein K456DRAFT_478096 [Colletotrichum gloeosporioides 23]|nr:hypothetical protein K456DRAFT_478096 [Colletotrichum gloeosporioides 23]
MDVRLDVPLRKNDTRVCAPNLQRTQAPRPAARRVKPLAVPHSNSQGQAADDLARHLSGRGTREAPSHRSATRRQEAERGSPYASTNGELSSAGSGRPRQRDCS